MTQFKHLYSTHRFRLLENLFSIFFHYKMHFLLFYREIQFVCFFRNSMYSFPLCLLVYFIS